MQPPGDLAHEKIAAARNLDRGFRKQAMKEAVVKDKSLESWIWDAACSIRGAKDAPKYKEYILPLIFAKRLCDVFDDELDRIAKEVGSRAKAFKLVKHDKKLVRFFLTARAQESGRRGVVDHSHSFKQDW